MLVAQRIAAAGGRGGVATALVPKPSRVSKWLFSARVTFCISQETTASRFLVFSLKRGSHTAWDRTRAHGSVGK